MVPGNHDIDRDVQKSVWESMRMRLAFSFGRRLAPAGQQALPDAAGGAPSGAGLLEAARAPDGGWTALRRGVRRLAARRDWFMSEEAARLPGFWRFVWLFWMQPVTLHHLLRRLKVDPAENGWKILRRRRSESDNWWLV